MFAELHAKAPSTWICGKVGPIRILGSDGFTRPLSGNVLSLDNDSIVNIRGLDYKIIREVYNSGAVYTGMSLDGEEITDGHDHPISAFNELNKCV